MHRARLSLNDDYDHCEDHKFVLSLTHSLPSKAESAREQLHRELFRLDRHPTEMTVTILSDVNINHHACMHLKPMKEATLSNSKNSINRVCKRNSTLVVCKVPRRDGAGIPQSWTQCEMKDGKRPSLNGKVPSTLTDGNLFEE